MNQIEKIRLYVFTHFSNTAWLRATNYAHLDPKHCGQDLWHLWFDPNHLSLYSIQYKNSLENWQALEKKFEIVFKNSVNSQNKRQKSN